MFNLTDKSISLLIISPESTLLSEKICTILYSRNYNIIPINSYLNKNYDKSFICINNDSNDKLREDSIYLIEKFNQSEIIVKYRNEDYYKKISSNGSEKILSMLMCEANEDSKIYLYNGSFFSFNEEKRYHILTNKNELKYGMIIEFFNNNRWVEKKIFNVDLEYENMYKLLIKYSKLRTCID